MREDQGNAITRAVTRLEEMVKGVPDECQMLCEEPDGTTAWSLTVADLRTVLAALREARADVARLDWLFEHLPFDVRHRFGGDTQEFREGIDAARAAGGTNG